MMHVVADFHVEYQAEVDEKLDAAHGAARSMHTPTGPAEFS
ncbi:hypothetical protein QFZ79_001703 [Arthrobacter sp. V4I6]|nr:MULTISPECIES: hypothetical protein [unclassified Arthrobacter]MDQ0819408.1 hypothetical protein [Arthrobacter sp. V1I7]MDQ0853592.1 hypothetical protein [Arthrobacter sp. V4I6]